MILLTKVSRVLQQSVQMSSISCSTAIACGEDAKRVVLQKLMNSHASSALIKLIEEL